MREGLESPIERVLDILLERHDVLSAKLDWLRWRILWEMDDADRGPEPPWPEEGK